MHRPLKLLMVGHSYCVALNRRLCHEVARVGGEGVDVTVAAPAFYHGDLRPITLEPLEGEPYALEPVPTIGSRVPHVFLYGRRLRTLLAEGWDVVHAWEEPYILAGAQIARQSPKGATLVYSSFQNQSKRYPPPFNWCERYALARASGWTAFGQTVAEGLKDRRGYRDRPMRTIPLGIDGEVYRPDLSARHCVLHGLDWDEPGPPIIGYLGRFVPEKGLGLLMRTLDRLDRSTWRALFIGGGRLEHELRTWAAKHPGRVRIVTGVSHSAVPPYLNAFDMMAAPSQTTPGWKEQLGRMLLEGMATGVPLVASDSGEIPHVVGEAGLVVGEADENGWVEALGGLLASPGRRAELRERGLERARTVYDWSRIARQFLDFFQELHGSTSGVRASGRPVAAPLI